MSDVLQTGRLVLQPLQIADAEQVQKLFPHWEIVKFLAAKVPWPFPADGVETFYRQVALPAIERGDEWHWTLRLKESGKGLMTEAVTAANDYWFDVLGFNILRAPKAIANLASRRISENTGMQVIATCESDYVSGRLPTEIWEITTEEWRAKRASLRDR